MIRYIGKYYVEVSKAVYRCLEMCLEMFFITDAIRQMHEVQYPKITVISLNYNSVTYSNEKTDPND